MEINKIYCESNLETMARMPDNFVDIVITSPPYNTGGKSLSTGNFYKEYKDNLEDKQYRDFIFKNVSELLRVTKYYIFYNFQILSNNKSIYLEFMNYFKENIKDICIWKNKQLHRYKRVKWQQVMNLLLFLGRIQK